MRQTNQAYCVVGVRTGRRYGDQDCSLDLYKISERSYLRSARWLFKVCQSICLTLPPPHLLYFPPSLQRDMRKCTPCAAALVHLPLVSYKPRGLVKLFASLLDDLLPRMPIKVKHGPVKEREICTTALAAIGSPSPLVPL